LTKEEYFSHGKLLLSGEFLVMEGATALAMPLKYGQKISVREGKDGQSILNWTSKYQSKKWFDARFDLRELEILETNDPVRAGFIRKILLAALGNNPLFMNKMEGKEVIASLDFDPDWGWGSSSTLTSNIAMWSETNPFDIFFETQEGSGYDIACARAGSPILYTMNGNSPIIKEVRLRKAITPFIYFAYLGHKQSTADGLRSYRQSRVFDTSDIQSISDISLEMVNADGLNDLNALIREHERIISKVIQKRPVKETLFSDFPGEVKSLGTWGGDFIMMTYEDGKKGLQDYLGKKDLDKLFSFDDITLNA
jgi:mevalonate kinase